MYTDNDNTTFVEGTVSTLVFHSEESGWAVLRLFMHDKGEEITLVGNMPYIAAGERVEAEGVWVDHPVYGQQFSVKSFKRYLPETEEEIILYLSTGAIRGIGPRTAERIVSKFGTETLDIISEDPDALATIRGITIQRAREICAAAGRQTAIRRLTDFLSDHGFPSSYALSLYNRYGTGAVNILKSNPYIMCSYEFEPDFGRVDAFALSTGIDEKSVIRIEAAVLYELYFNQQNGHVFIPRGKLCSATSKLLGIDEDTVDEVIGQMGDKNKVELEEICGEIAVYPPEMIYAERQIAKSILRLSKVEFPMREENLKAIKEAEQETDIEFTPLQKEAIKTAAKRGIMILTGGPGTGKTTTVRGMLSLFKRLRLKTVLAAPTGKAAKRLGELSGEDTKTIHRLLEATVADNGQGVRFGRNEENPIIADVVVIDEASMLDIALANQLFSALQPGARVVLVGDPDQLPPIGPGNFLRDIIKSKTCPVVELSEIFRQAQKSDIIVNAHKIKAGKMPQLDNRSGSDFFFIKRLSAQTAFDAVIEMCGNRIPLKFGIPFENIQILAPMRKGASGTDNLNKILQSVMNPPEEGKNEIRFGNSIFREGDRVIQVRNNYELTYWTNGGGNDGMGIFNGDMGIVEAVDPRLERMVVRFDDRFYEYTLPMLNEIELSYALTVHKAQGSEFDAVVFMAQSGSMRLLNRSVLYTAVTRAKKLLVAIGNDEVISEMVSNNTRTSRYSALRARITEKGIKRLG